MANALRNLRPAATPRPCEIIQKQIGALAFRMLGTTAMTTDSRSLSLRFNVRGSRKCTAVVVKLEPSDTYTVEFWKITARTCVKTAEASDVYCDALLGVITQHTGLYTRI